MEKICYSGGADGSDEAWGDEARKRGYRVVHYSFPGHKTTAPVGELLRLSDTDLRDANVACKEAASHLGRTWPPQSAYVRKLLQRNYWQIRSTGSVYAVGQFDDEGNIEGGTAWATQMYSNRQLPDRPARLYFFDQVARAWVQRVASKNAEDLKWREVKPPPPTEVFTGIGTRKINEHGRKAIGEVFW